MSKYNALWEWIRENGTDSFKLTFDEIGQIAGAPIDHSFLVYKKELIGRLSELEEITYRAMMGEFIIYYRGKVVGVYTMICVDNTQ